jgi:hypothetical protein
MSVILFPSWRVFCYVDGLGRNVIRHWLANLQASAPDRGSLQNLFDICEHSGPDALVNCTWDLGDGFYAVRTKRKGSIELSPIFVRGPFGESEITFLAGALIKGQALSPRYAVGIAEENLEALLEEPQRRRRERVT